MSAYQNLETRFRRLNALREAAGVLHWDMSTVMPQGGAEARGEQLAALDVTCHEMMADEALADLFAEVESDSAQLDPWRRANLREMRREWRHATAVDAALVEALSKASMRCEMTWRSARPANDFAAVLPGLKEVLGLVRESADAKAAALGRTPYDALLDQYEPGGSSEGIAEIFGDLAAFLPGFLEQVTAEVRGQAVIAIQSVKVEEDR